MDQGPIVLDISSDEEPNWGEPKFVDFDLLSELLADIDKQTEDDSDEVVVVSEVNPKRRPKYSKTMVREPDDDCVVLDGDPDKPVKAVIESENGSDEILIVGEKGQVINLSHSEQLIVVLFSYIFFLIRLLCKWMK